MRDDIDVEALERLLAALDTDRRAWLLARLRQGAISSARAAGLVANFIQPAFAEPELQRMLDAVYEPRRARHRALLAKRV